MRNRRIAAIVVAQREWSEKIFVVLWGGQAYIGERNTDLTLNILTISLQHKDH
jgi:hypothetical protein